MPDTLRHIHIAYRDGSDASRAYTLMKLIEKSKQCIGDREGRGRRWGREWRTDTGAPPTLTKAA